jgi:hypothetical protein
MSSSSRVSSERSTASVATVCGQMRLTRTPSMVPREPSSSGSPRPLRPHTRRPDKGSAPSAADDATLTMNDDWRSPLELNLVSEHVEPGQILERLGDHPSSTAGLTQIHRDLAVLAIGDHHACGRHPADQPRWPRRCLTPRPSRARCGRKAPSAGSTPIVDAGRLGDIPEHWPRRCTSCSGAATI